MALPAFVTVNGRQYRGTTAFARGWVDANGGAIAIPASDPYPSGLGASILDLLLGAIADADATRDTTVDGDTTALEAALASLGREKLAFIAPLAAPGGTFADLAAATTYATNLDAKLTALLGALVTKGYMSAS